MSVQAEYEAARAAVALLPLPTRQLAVLRGERRVSFLQGMISNDVEAVGAGDGCHALLLDTKGRVIADLDLWADDDQLVLATSSSVMGDVLATLRKYVLAAPVEIEDLGESRCVIGLVGPRSEDLLRAAASELPAGSPRAHVATTIAGYEVRIAKTPTLAAPGAELHLGVEAAGAVEAELRAAAGSELARVSEETAEVLRVEAGVPAHGRELTGEQFPQEARLDDAISYEKGCYLGQETVARIHYRGQVNRLLVGLGFAAPAQPGAALSAADREVGTVTSAVVSPAQGPLGLGYVRRELAGVGSELTLATSDGEGARAEVVNLPPRTSGE